MGKRGSFLARFALVMSALVAGAIIAPSSASAGSSCSYPLCSTTWNASGYSALVSHDWCDGNNGPCSGSQSKWLSPNESTAGTGDWDTFRVDAGWCSKVTWYTLNQNLQYVPYWWSTYDQVGKGDLWKKVSNNELAKITSQRASHC
ncbi:hypothetical protein HRW07_04595 [Streptomyces lunaelactis]|uniref:hypothetical protein n=1 Tax=Streptomyces lunaelactis TaxID=1535768 RepID=UPI001585290F|nr:hypothetical protein [Streptomyces lunaelactis]NUL02535.1 hypothetical protein [Streptomyces lunaelactis]